MSGRRIPGRGQQRPNFPVVSVMLSDWLPAIMSLVEVLRNRVPEPPNRFQANRDENSFAAAVTLLSAVLLESAAVRARISRQAVDRDAFEFLERLWNNEADLQNPGKTSGLKPTLWEAVEELVFVRDSLAHNYIFEAFVAWSPSGGLLATRGKLRAEFGTQRQRRATARRPALTPKLKLNLSPVRVWTRDAYLALHTTLRAIEWLGGLQNTGVFETMPPVRFDGQMLCEWSQLREAIARLIDGLPRPPS
jgi:hypothetical protein